MRVPIICAGSAVALLLTSAGCGGGSSSNPGAPSPQPGGAAVISIVGDRGAQSFSPNPGSGGPSQTVVWRNNDTVTHRIVVNDSTQDTGNIAPGGTSSSLQLPPAGVNYHCSIHPGMIGSVMASGGSPPPPCTGVYC